MKIHTRGTQTGLSMIEVLISVAIVAMGAIAILRYINYSAYENNLTAQKADATTIAQSQIETLRDYQALVDTAGLTSYQSIASGTATINGASATYTVAWTVATNTSPDYKDVTVTVSWPDRYGASQSTSLSSRIVGLEPTKSAEIM